MSECKKFNFSESNGCSNIDIDYDWSVSCTDVDENNNPINLNGFTSEVIIKDSNDNTLFTLVDVPDALTTGIYMPSPSSGEMFIQMMKADTSTLSAGNYKYEWSLISPSGLSELFLFGYIHATIGVF